MERLQEYYLKTIRPELASELKISNLLAVPRITKILVNLGLGQVRNDEKKIATLERALATITGQKPVRRLARKSVASFKLRQGDVVALSLTLRGSRMYDFLERLIRIALPRVRDFRGIPETSFDGHGNLTIGLRELGVFPEIRYEDVDLSHGLEITIVTTARTDAEGIALLRRLGLPLARSPKAEVRNQTQ